MSRKPQPPQPTKTKWHVYKLAAKRQWVGEIEVVDERQAIEIAAKEFKQPAKKANGSAAAMTRRKGELTRADLNRKWPYHVALAAEKVSGLKNSEEVHGFAKTLSAAPADVLHPRR